MNVLVLLLISQSPANDRLGREVRVAAFLGVECPLARLYGQRLNELHTEFPQVEFRAYAPNRQDSDDEVAELQKVLDFPIARDTTEARRLGAAFSPEVFLIESGRVVYSGRIDDQYLPGQHRLAPTRRDLATAINEVLAGQSVSVPRTEPAGCHLNLDSPPTRNSADALRVIHAKCATCHHPGTAAPFSLLTFQDARNWHATIRDVINDGRMPPWGATIGKFGNDRRLTETERRALLEWIDAGCPEGARVAPPVFSNGWSFEPDLVQTAPEFHVPATGTLDYQDFRLPVFSRDTWVSAIEMRGSRAVHHINALLEPADADPSRRYAVNGDSYLATMVTGNPGIELPSGMAKLIPANWRIRLEVHYEPIGAPVIDRSAIALKLTNRPQRHVITQMMLKSDIILPPDAVTVDHQTWLLDRDYTLLAIFPHMHLRGKSMRVETRIAGQPPEVLVDVPRYDYAWQDRYVLAEPRNLPAGTVIHVTAEWDNTRGNPVNPDSSQTVRAGKRAIDEMFQCSLDVYETREQTRPPSSWLSILAIALVCACYRITRRR